MSGVARDETFTKLSTLFEKLLADLSEKHCRPDLVKSWWQAVRLQAR